MGAQRLTATGTVYIRFAEAERAEKHAGAIEAAGYRIERVPDYAPHTAWLRHRTDDVGEALRHLDALRALTEIEHVEAQMLADRTRRPG